MRQKNKKVTKDEHKI